MKKRIVIIACLITLIFTGAAIAEIVQHSGKRGVAGYLGDSGHIWRELWVNEAHFPKRIAVDICSVFVDGTGPITAASAPNVATADNVGAITWDDSSETAEVQFTWAPSTGYVDGMQVELVVSSDAADGTDKLFTWSVFVQDTDLAFGSATAQTAVACTSATLDASNELVTLTLNATAEALITAGSSVVTIAIANSNASGGAGSTEIKNITILEP